MSTIWAFDQIENKISLYHGEDCMKKIRSSQREHVTNLIDFEKGKTLPLTKKELKSHHSQNSLLKIKIIEKLETIDILHVNTEGKQIVYVT